MSRRILAIPMLIVALMGCTPEEEAPDEAPTPGPTATASPSPTPVTGPTATPTPDPAAEALIACLQDEGLDAEEGPFGDLSEDFQVGVGSHPQFQYQVVVLGYEDRDEAMGDRRDLEEGAEQIGGDLPDIRLVGRTLIFVLDEELPEGDLAAIEGCARSTV